jgi:hypothetical protein
MRISRGFSLASRKFVSTADIRYLQASCEENATILESAYALP